MSRPKYRRRMPGAPSHSTLDVLTISLALTIGAGVTGLAAGTAHADRGWIHASHTPFQLALGPPDAQLFSDTAHVTGLRISLLYGVQKKITGLDFGLFGDAYRMRGLQLGLGNQAKESLHGVQLGVANSADHGAGVQIGLLNHTHALHGLQIGLLNWNDEGWLPFFPLVNFHF